MITSSRSSNPVLTAHGTRAGGNRVLASLALLLSLGLLAFPMAGGAHAAKTAPAKEVCYDCHGDKDFSKGDGDKKVSLFVEAERFGKSVHSSLACRDCHVGLNLEKHQDGSVPYKAVECGGCHSEEAKIYRTSIHGMSNSTGSSAAATCHNCHGNHYIVPVRQADSPVFKFNLPGTCVKCHANKTITAEYKMKYPEVVSQFQESIHGQALLKKGLIVAPSCNDCHGVHDIRRAVDRSSPINHANVAKTCGKCHTRVEETYNKSIHGQLLAKGDPRGPVCINCHSAHEIESPSAGHLKANADKICGKCHVDRLENYRDTYHGKAMALGKANTAVQVAACFDCHGHHDVLPVSDNASRLSPANKVKTCQQCHPKATASFAKYAPHADHRDRKNYPALYFVFLGMTVLLVGTFAFFGLHTLLWLARSAYLYKTDSKQFREAKLALHDDDEVFTRFQPFERFLHLLIVSSFLLLVLTGMPLKFYYSGWAKAMFSFMGGPSVARTLHHFGAVITFLYFTLHVTNMVGKLWKRRGYLFNPETGKFEFDRLMSAAFHPDSMIPGKDDLNDLIAHNKWFWGNGPRPDFDRWTYFEKFDYLAVFWGIFMIGLSGLIMWFPETFSLVLPGWIINIALVIHSDEALLASGFIFSIHFFNTHFRLEKFPMDTVIFSGRITKSEMLHERKRWYDRLVREGRLDDFRVKDEWESWKKIAKSFGFLFFGTGVMLLVLIVYALLSRLGH